LKIQKKTQNIKENWIKNFVHTWASDTHHISIKEWVKLVVLSQIIFKRAMVTNFINKGKGEKRKMLEKE
jgi:hypothetical protein